MTTDENGEVVSEVRYHPYGEERWANGEAVTDFGFTSQRTEKGFNLHDYNARYYSSVLGRFISPDTIVPEPGSSGGFNRYRYTRNNPLKYTDPTGHIECEGATGCIETPAPPAPGVDDAWDRAVSFDSNFPYGAYLDGQARYEYYEANPSAYARDQALSTELASYNTDIADIYGNYALGECLECRMDNRLGVAAAGGLIPSFGTAGPIGNGFGGEDFEDDISILRSSVRPGQQRRQPGGPPSYNKSIPKKPSGLTPKGPPQPDRNHKPPGLDPNDPIEQLAKTLKDPNVSKTRKVVAGVTIAARIIASGFGLTKGHP